MSGSQQDPKLAEFLRLERRGAPYGGPEYTGLNWHVFRRQQHAARAAFANVRKSENNYASRLRRLATHINNIIHDFVVANDYTPETLPFNSVELSNLLRRYADILTPWATSVASRMIAETARRDWAAWKAHSRQMSRSLEEEIAGAPIGEALRGELARQVGLIRSLPEEAANLVHKVAMENLISGTRSASLADILRTRGSLSPLPTQATEVAEALAERMRAIRGITEHRADLIARTETARVASILTQVRAQHIGGTHYLWRTQRDSRVRDSHEWMGYRSDRGELFEWSNPPVVEEGRPPYHPGQIYNCRCYAEPIIPDHL